MADKIIVIPDNGDPGDTHVKNGDRVCWQSASRACTVGFAQSPFRQTGGPQSIAVPHGGSSQWEVVAGRPDHYPYGIAFGAAATDPEVIVDQ